jgi:hypothetical protein
MQSDKLYTIYRWIPITTWELTDWHSPAEREFVSNNNVPMCISRSIVWDGKEEPSVCIYEESGESYAIKHIEEQQRDVDS